MILLIHEANSLPVKKLLVAQAFTNKHTIMHVVYTGTRTHMYMYMYMYMRMYMQLW